MSKEKMKQLLKEGWKAIFPESEAEDDSDFFDDGGDSIKAVQLVSWLMQKGVKLDMVKIFTDSKLINLAETLEETQPMYVPSEMLTKDILRDQIGIDPAMVSAFPNNNASAKTVPAQDQQMCTPAQDQQMCTPTQDQQMCTPAQNQQMCTPAQNQQMCTPAQNQQMCTPVQNYPQYGIMEYGMNMPYMLGSSFMMPMMVMMPVTFVPMMSPANMFPMPMMPAAQMPMATGNMAQRNMLTNTGILPNILSKYQAHPVQEPIENPNVMNIPEPKVGTPTESPEQALDAVLKGLLPTFDRNIGLFEQGFTSLNLMQIVTRLAEHGYKIKMENIISDPTFDGLLSNMKAGM
ncbi:MAG: hypothetical protein IJ583_07490 [Firmicutes bacterium]|nr:hypothetical protein [Bacillota bacterium]